MLLRREQNKGPALPDKSDTRLKLRIKHFRKTPTFLRQYMINSTLHGLKYTVSPELHPLERLLWIVLFATCAGYSIHVSYSFAKKFQNAPTSIDIESMTYVISELPFPSVTICPNDHVDWKKAMALQGTIVPYADNETQKTFQKLMGTLSAATFGDYDLFTFLQNRTNDDLLEINITELLMNVTPSCETFFSNCWWRNANRDCCEIFELQRTEYGLCYSFNSELSEARRNESWKDGRPRRTASYGDWSGIRVTVHLGNMTRPPISTEIEGIMLMVNDPRIWPNNGNTIAAGMAQDVGIECISGYATEDVLALEDSKKPCRQERTGFYTQETCVSLCKRQYAIDLCGCNPSTFFPPISVRECQVKDIFCLMNYNDLFNGYQLLKKGDHPTGTDKSKLDMILCDCPPECEYYGYSTRQVGAPIERKTDIRLDIHFAGPMSARYKTDIVFTKLELLVSVGGIMGLFLGGSLLSFFELIYYFGISTFSYLRRFCKRRKKLQARRFTAAPILPILDYGPTRQKPNFAAGPRLITFDRRIQDFPSLKNRY